MSWCTEWWWCTESPPPGTGIALGPGGGARPCRDCKPAFEPKSRAGLCDVWSGVPEGVLSSSELPKRVLFPFMEEESGLWLLLLEFSLFSLKGKGNSILIGCKLNRHFTTLTCKYKKGRKAKFTIHIFVNHLLRRHLEKAHTVKATFHFSLFTFSNHAYQLVHVVFNG